MAEEQKPDQLFESELQQLEELRRANEDFLTRRVTRWGIRWAIGFALIWAAVAHEPAWHWLWWVGAGVATLSLAAIFVARALVERKFRQTRAAAERARVEIEMAEEET